MRHSTLPILLSAAAVAAPAGAQTAPPVLASFRPPPPRFDPVAPTSPVLHELRRPHRSWPTPALGASASGDPEVLFTFDDGPSAPYTEAVLDTLRAHDVQAIFFMVARRLGPGLHSTPRVRALIDRMLSDGNAIGNHTLSHRDLCRKRNAAAIRAEIDDAARALTEASGMPMVLFRTPYGVRCAQIEDALAARGLHHIHWDIDPQEWRTHDTRRTEAILIHAIDRLRDGQRAVILTHDIHAETVRALPIVLDWLVAENARRRAAGQREIRVLQPADIALEKLAPGVGAALGGAAQTADALLTDLERRFVAPLTAPRAHAAEER